MSEVNYSGEPNSCNCPILPVPHSHLDKLNDGHGLAEMTWALYSKVNEIIAHNMLLQARIDKLEAMSHNS